MSAPLAGLRVLVTRPQPQADALAQRLRAQGALPSVFPTLAIVPCADVRALAEACARLSDFDLALFVSANAVERAAPLIRAHACRLPAIGAVGAATARALSRHGLAASLVPEDRFDSEALLALPALAHVADRRVVVFRGPPGRELLGKTLIERGARVEYVECYRRVRPEVDSAPLIADLQAGRIDVVVATSGEALANLVDLAGETRERLLALPVCLVSERLARAWRALGGTGRPLVASRADDEALIERLKTWREDEIYL